MANVKGKLVGPPAHRPRCIDGEYQPRQPRVKTSPGLVVYDGETPDETRGETQLTLPPPNPRR